MSDVHCITRACKKCGVIKPLTDFPKHPTCKDGRMWTCGECHRDLKENPVFKNDNGRIEPYTGGCRRVEHLEAPARWLIHRWTKIARDRGGVPDDADRVFLDDVTTKVLRLVIALSEKRGATIEQLCADNLAKLAGRKERGTLAGSGVR